MNYVEFQNMRKEAATAAESARQSDAALMRDEVLGAPYMARMAPAEMLAHGAGAVGGGALGYLLSKMVHRKPSGFLRTLYTLGGAVAGGTLPYYMLRSGTDSNGMTTADRLRLQHAWANAPESLQKKRNELDNIAFTDQSKGEPFKYLKPGYTMGVGGALGALGDARQYMKDRAKYLDSLGTEQVKTIETPRYSAAGKKLKPGITTETTRLVAPKPSLSLRGGNITRRYGRTGLGLLGGLVISGLNEAVHAPTPTSPISQTDLQRAIQERNGNRPSYSDVVKNSK